MEWPDFELPVMGDVVGNPPRIRLDSHFQFFVK